MINRLTDKQQKALAVALLGVVIMLFYLAIISPVLARAQHYDEKIDDLQFQLQRLKKIAAAEDILLKRMEEIKQQQSENRHLRAGDTPALASADLQKFVGDKVKETGGNLISTQVVPARQEEQFTRIAIKVRLSGTIETLRDTLYAIESARPLLIVENLDIRPFRRRRNPVTRRYEPSDELNINFEVVGYMRAASV